MRADRAGQDQAARDAAAGQQLRHPAPVRGQIDDVFLQLPERVPAGRRQVRLRPQVRVGVADHVGHEAVQLAPEELRSASLACEMIGIVPPEWTEADRAWP